MIRTSHRWTPVCTIALAVTCLGTALPAHAGASLEVGYFSNGNWVTLQGTASGVMRICVKYMPPAGREAIGVSLQQIRVTDKRGQHTIPVQFDAGVPLPGGKAVAYLWRSFLDTNGPISIEADGTGTSRKKTFPSDQSTESFTVSCSCESENLTVVSVTNDSCLSDWGLVAFAPDSPTHTLTVNLSDALDPHGATSDTGNVGIALCHIGPDGLNGLAWSANYPNEPLGGPRQFTPWAQDSDTAVYAPNVGAYEVDEDHHSWYSPYVEVDGVSVAREAVTAPRTMCVRVAHTNVVTDATPPSTLAATVVRTIPIEPVANSALVCSPGEHTDYVPNVGPLEAAGTYWVAVTGHDGHGGVSKYAGNIEHPVEPALASLTVPSATCIAGDNQGGAPYNEARARAQEWYAALGLVDAPSQQPCDAEFFCTRYEYGPQGPVARGGYQVEPTKAETLEALFTDDVVVFNGHGTFDATFNRASDPITAQDVLDRAQTGPSQARFVFLKCCLAANVFAPALAASGAFCVVAFAGEIDSDEAGWIEFMHCLCDESMKVDEAIKHMKDTDPEWDIHGEYNVWSSGGGHRGLWEVQT